MTNAN